MSDMSKFKVGANTYDIKDEKSRGVPLTWAQYQALSYEEQHNGTAYYITDMDAVYPVDHELNANSRNAVANDIVTPHILAMENVLGAKNVLPVSLKELKAINTSGSWDENVYTIAGMTYTVNKNCSITLNGTPTEDALFFFERSSIIYTNKNLSYIMTGCPSNGSIETYWIESYIRNHDGQSVKTIRDTGEGVIFNISDTPNAEYVDVVMIIVKANVAVNNLVFKPMIRPAGTDPTYVPYAMTNEQLTDAVNRGSVSVTADGVKTYKQLLNELYSLIDRNRMTKDTKLVLKRYALTYVPLAINNPEALVFSGLVDFNASGRFYTYNFYLEPNDSAFVNTETSATQTTFVNDSSAILQSGYSIAILY